MSKSNGIWLSVIFVAILASTMLTLPPALASSPPFSPSPPFTWTLTIKAWNKDTATPISGVEVKVHKPDTTTWPPSLSVFQGYASTPWGPGQGGAANMPEASIWWTFLAPETLQYNATHRKKFNHWELLWKTNAEVMGSNGTLTTAAPQIVWGRILKVRALSAGADVGIEARYHEERLPPNVNTLIFKMFLEDPDAEYSALQAGDIDIMEWPLSGPQYTAWATGNSPGVSVARTKDHGMRELDINNNKTVSGLPGGTYTYPNWNSPTGYKDFRQAIALMVDKAWVIGVAAAGVAERLDVPLPSPIHEPFINPAVVAEWTSPIGDWYVPGYPGTTDLTEAAIKLDHAGWKQGTPTSGYESVPNPYYDSGTPGSAQYMRVYPVGHQLAGTSMDGEPLIFYGRTDPIRSVIAAQLTSMLRKSGIPVNLQIKPSTVAYAQVMQLFSYHLYTGGWGFGLDSDQMHDFYSQEFANPMDYNYNGFNGHGPAMPNSFTWNYATNGMGANNETVTLVTPGTGEGYEKKWKYDSTGASGGWSGALWEQAIDEVKNPKVLNGLQNLIAASQFAQKVLWGKDGMMPHIPLFRFSPSYTGYRSGWKDLVNEEGTGVGNWLSTVAGYKPGTNTMVYGLMSYVIGLNEVTAEWTWDYEVLTRMYDSLMSVDNYDPAKYDVLTGMAEWWKSTTWNDAGTDKSELQFRIRQNMKWHDLTHVTIDDVAFSLLYHQAQLAWWYSSVMYIKQIITRNGGTVPPGATATWTADPTMEPDEIIVRLDVESFFALHWIGFVPIIMKRIWENVPNAYAYNPITDDADGSGTNDLFEDGTGPFKFAEFVTDDHVTVTAFRDYFLTAKQISDFKKEAFHRLGDADYNAMIQTDDLNAVSGLFSLSAPGTTGSAYPSAPTNWADDHYTDMTYSPPVAGDPYTTGDSPPFDRWSNVGCSSTPPRPYPWLNADVNYDYYVKVEDLSAIAKHFNWLANGDPTPPVIGDQTDGW